MSDEPQPARALALPRPRGLEWAVLLVYLAFALRERWVCEDAYITFRYSWMVAHGEGVVFNHGMAPVEGYSDFLWVLAGALFELVDFPAWVGIHVLSIPAGLVLLLLFRHVASVHLGVSEGAARLAMLGLAVFPAISTWATSGLEVMPQALAYFAAACGLAFADDRRDLRLTALAGLSLALLRTEGILWSPVLMALGAIVRWQDGRPILKPLLRYAAVVFGVWAIYYAWRVSYYHTWVPNTVTAKAGMSAGTLGRGAYYLIFFALLEIPVLLAPLAWWSARGRVSASRLLWLALLCVGVPAWAMLVGGDYMWQFRFLVPAVPFLLLSAAVGYESLLRARGPALAGAVGAVLTVAAWLPAEDLSVVPEPAIVPFCISVENPEEGDVHVHKGACRRGGGRGRNLRLEAFALGEFTKGGDKVVTGAVGNLGYFNPRVRLLDLCGLVTREVAEREVEVDGDKRPGHDRCTGPGVFYDDNPDVLVFTTFQNPKNPARAVGRTVESWADKHAKKSYFPDFMKFEHPKYPGEIVYAVGLRRAKTEDEMSKGRAAYKAKLAELEAEVSGE
jgi:hypothetical protein